MFVVLTTIPNSIQHFLDNPHNYRHDYPNRQLAHYWGHEKSVSRHISPNGSPPREEGPLCGPLGRA